eukprot:TRINITY_DN4910_c0_g1_i1.p1 TRINITY_DN4910_c0_g1~~TRINITY_DN4910_c0_g1_i1.p1  ORF type:complete len:408 (+),score=109.19 TRINITY_DN4910_c0_g1_i1:72-1226(+)
MAASAAPLTDGAAIDYLTRHNVPALVDRVISQLIQERPADPRAFLARQFMGPAEHLRGCVKENGRDKERDHPPVSFVFRAHTEQSGPAKDPGSAESYFVPSAASFTAGGSDDFSIYQAHNTKHVWFLRHAQAEHNTRLAACADDNAKLAEVRNDPSLWDAPLTPAGLLQAHRLRDTLEGVHGSLGFRPQLIVVSPLTRSMETAVGVFGQDHIKHGEVSGSIGEEDHHGLVHSPPRWVANELCRERIAYTYNGRGSVSDLQKRYPFVDCSLVPSDKDELWESHQEPAGGEAAEAVVGDRADAFLRWLMTRSERRIVVVTNAAFMRALFLRYGFSLSNMEAHRFASMPHNCEIRRVVVCPHRNPQQMKIADKYRPWIKLDDHCFEQ